MQVPGIEPGSTAWQAAIRPLNQTCFVRIESSDADRLTTNHRVTDDRLCYGDSSHQAASSVYCVQLSPFISSYTPGSPSSPPMHGDARDEEPAYDERAESAWL